ncbi:MAG: efflux RND transporter periplasmic adaptor subunit [Deltaproteobacteria bacterium]|nr:efflux RND transporter periplasmic adaptor subunit [Deltaproteobacteria bacterium]
MEKSESKTRILRFFWGVFPWLIVMAILVFIGVMYFNIKDEKARLDKAKKEALKTEVPAVKVITLTLKAKRLEDKINLPAEIEPYENLWVKAEVSGQILDVLVKEGQTVRKGQVLVELDDRDYITRLERIEANYSLAMLDQDRVAKLVKGKIYAATELDNIEARLKDLTAQLKEAKLAISRTRITAPISGRLNEIKAKKGDWMGANKPVAQILQFEKVKVTVGVPESDVAAVFDLKEANIIIEALEGRRVKGRKLFLSRQPRTLARLYDLELVVPNPDGHILPGMFARVELVRHVYDNAISIPLYAVITRGDDRFVYVEKGNKAEKRSIELGMLIGWQVHVKSGLNPGERVIIVGHRLLDEGQKVDIIKNVTDPQEILKS